MGHTFYTLGTTAFSHLAESIVLYATGPIKGMPVTMDGEQVGTADTPGEDEFGHRVQVDVTTGALSYTKSTSGVAFPHGYPFCSPISSIIAEMEPGSP